MEKKKVLFVATVVKTHMMQFHIPYLKMFQEMGWETAVASRNDYENPEDCKIPYCDTYYDIPFERMPWKPKNLQAYRMLKKIIDENDYDLIHCHTPVGAMIARLAALSARKKGTKVIVRSRYQSGSYTNRDGQKVYTHEFVIDDIEFAESKSAAAQNQEQYTQQTQTQAPQQSAPAAGKSIDDYVNIPDMPEDLPFA